MEKEKQIEALAKDIACNIAWDEDEIPTVNCLETAKRLYLKDYRKASDVALETMDDVLSRLRHIFLAMCNYNDYNKLTLLQIDNAIEALYDTFIAELKKKYTEEQ